MAFSSSKPVYARSTARHARGTASFNQLTHPHNSVATQPQRAQRVQPQRTQRTRHARVEPQRVQKLRVVETPDVSRRSVMDLGTILGLCLFGGFMCLAGLHAVLVQNQAQLDEVIAENVMRREKIDSLLADIAYIDSPQGIQEQADALGLEPATQVATLIPVKFGELPPPGVDPFGLAEFADDIAASLDGTVTSVDITIDSAKDSDGVGIEDVGSEGVGLGGDTSVVEVTNGGA